MRDELPLQFLVGELGDCIDHFCLVFFFFQHLVSLLDGHLMPMIVFFADLPSLNLLLQSKLIQAHFLIVLPLHFRTMLFSSFLFGPEVLPNAVDLFLQLHLLPHYFFLTLIPDADIKVLMELLCWLFQQRLLMQFLQSLGLLLLLLLVLQLKFIQSFIFLDEPIKRLLFFCALKLHLLLSSLLLLLFVI